MHTCVVVLQIYALEKQLKLGILDGPGRKKLQEVCSRLRSHIELLLFVPFYYASCIYKGLQCRDPGRPEGAVSCVSVFRCEAWFDLHASFF